MIRSRSGLECAACRYGGNAHDAELCSLCGVLLRPGQVNAPTDAELAGRVSTEPGLRAPPSLESGSVDRVAAREARARDVGAALRFLGIGLVCGPLFLFAPFLSTMGWFLSALFHELGHTVVAWFFGMPTIPKIALNGHAMSSSDAQQVWMSWAVCIGLVWWAQSLRRSGSAPAVWIALGCAALIQPLLAFGAGGELAILLGGHLGELAMATICFWRCMSGGFTESPVERALYGALGWFLVMEHAQLVAGLAFSAQARADYHGSGSFGLVNDYIRVADNVLGCSLDAVGLGMLAITLLPLPLAWLIWRLRPW